MFARPSSNDKLIVRLISGAATERISILTGLYHQKSFISAKILSGMGLLQPQNVGFSPLPA